MQSSNFVFGLNKCTIFETFFSSFRCTAKEQLVSWSEIKVNENGHKDGSRLVLKHKKVQSSV